MQLNIQNCISQHVILFLVNHIQKSKEMIVEGELRSRKLLDYLEKTKSPKSIFLSEDGSGIVQNIVFDRRSNQLVGLVLPLNDQTGMPELFSYEAKSAEEIEQYCKLQKSHLVYIVCAQPLKKGVPPFILQIFGTNNKFKSEHVLKRWKYTIAELQK